MDPPRYRRAVLKISGEDGFASGHPGFDLARIGRLAELIGEARALGTELAVVVGGGNVVRGASFAQHGMNPATADYMGMLATVLNAVALQDALERREIETRCLTAIHVGELAEPYIRRRALRHLERGRVVILAAGTGNPTFTTDTAAAVRAAELQADVLLKGTKVDGVYDRDPMQHPDATRFAALTYQHVIERHLRVMDATAITLCRERGLPVVVFNLWQDGALLGALRGEPVGTTIGAAGD